ncbi:UDP-glucose/GDP-mannose dehydrogenase family protein [Leucobacter viscericola]|uniref:UDP-glucose 6-dehydrogenase n=1 Tax=Leucobacter viscericola TaxID=2714935 RepID=A0A6G7XEY8_9MICO|nr:UDP-glucose/GDP-mannose dehydrogenase family protein [Leucobacter viscericola]QIK62931.1 UDP-glucose/GDP-mannose dehydrogenase family protein [Leucobacter viscericola]
MRISVIGCGHLGAVHAVTLASLGHSVVGIDVCEATIASLSSGRPTFLEPGLREGLRDQLSSGRLTFSTDVSLARGADAHFVCVGTPAKADGEADLGALFAAVDALAPLLTENDVLIGKSTVPVGTARLVAARVRAAVAWNPEFLREGTAIADSLRPDRIIIGADTAAAQERVAAVYSGLSAAGVPILRTGLESAELAKAASNAFLALRLSYINSLAQLCEATGADVRELSAAMGSDARIGSSYFNAGLGYGGGCLPKDLSALRAQALHAEAMDLFHLLDTTARTNQTALQRAAELVLGAILPGEKIAILGLTFKPNTDDVRQSPALNLVSQLVSHGLSDFACTDPALVGTAVSLATGVCQVSDLHSALEGAAVVVLATEWPEYTAERVTRGSPRVVLDLRNALDPASVRAQGSQYIGLGQGPSLSPAPSPTTVPQTT